MTILKNIFTPLLIIALSLNVAVAQGDFDPVKFEESLKNASFKDKLEAANALMEDQLYVYAVKVLINFNRSLAISYTSSTISLLATLGS